MVKRLKPTTLMVNKEKKKTCQTKTLLTTTTPFNRKNTESKKTKTTTFPLLDEFKQNQSIKKDPKKPLHSNYLSLLGMLFMSKRINFLMKKHNGCCHFHNK